MNKGKLIDILSGLLFISSGIAILFHIRLLVPIDINALLGLFFVALGAALALRSSLGSSLTFALAVITFTLSLGAPSLMLSYNAERINFNVTYGNCKYFKVNSQMSDVVVSVGVNENSAYGYTVKRGTVEGRCGLEICCGEGRVGLVKPRAIEVHAALSSVRLELNRCVRNITILDHLGSVELDYNVPEGCSGTLNLESVLGSSTILLKVPKGVKVIYSISSNLGSYSVVLPFGKGGKEGSYGEGRTVMWIRISSSMGSVHLIVQRK